MLLRSGIGGPATGEYLRLHPCTATLGDYGEDMQGWWGAPHTGLINEFADTGDGYGFLIEGVQYTTGLGASALPWTTAAQHKAALADFREAAHLHRPRARPRARARDDRRAGYGGALV